jgi:hypothetical protein
MAQDPIPSHPTRTYGALYGERLNNPFGLDEDTQELLIARRSVRTF